MKKHRQMTDQEIEASAAALCEALFNKADAMGLTPEGAWLTLEVAALMSKSALEHAGEQVDSGAGMKEAKERLERLRPALEKRHAETKEILNEQDAKEAN